MDNGPKPTRLWHWTGRKHFNRVLSNKFESIRWLHAHEARARKDTAKLFILTVLLGVAGAYAMGQLDPTKFISGTAFTSEENDCTIKTGVKCPHTKPPGLPPCPCIEEDKCPMEWMKEEEKNRKQS